MTKEEIEKAIENGETVYYYLYGKYHEEKLNRSYFIQEFCDKDCLFKAYCDFDDDAKEQYILPLSKIYKTKEEAQEYLEFGNVTRTERLELPSWKEIYDGYELKFNSHSNSYILVYMCGNITIYRQERIGQYRMFDEEATKENYDEARRLCVKLFKGGNV